MQHYLKLAILILAALLLAACGKSKAQFHDLSTPANALKTTFSTIQANDAEGFRKILSAQTLQFVAEESQRTGKAVLNNYVSRLHSEGRSDISEMQEE